MKAQPLSKALKQVPEEYLWGVIVYFYNRPEDNTMVHTFCGSYIDINPKTCEFNVYADDATFEDLKEEIEYRRQKDKLDEIFNVTFGTHEKYGTDCVRIAMKM